MGLWGKIIKGNREIVKNLPMMGTGGGGNLLFDHLFDTAFREGEKDGIIIGKKEGYEQASYEYEMKLLSQAEKFLQQNEMFIKHRQDYEQLLDEYEKYIESMANKKDLSIEAAQYLQEIMFTERELKKL